MLNFLEMLTEDNVDQEDEIDAITSILNEGELNESSSSSDDSDFESVAHPKCKNFVNTIDLFDDIDFKSHMRLKRSTVEYLIGRYELAEMPSERNLNGVGVPKTSAKLQIYMYLWYMANTVTYRQLGNLFGVSKSTAWVCTNRVIAWVISIAHEYITWPSGAAAENISRKFYERTKIPGVIGAIDCTHISINAPKIDKQAYFDRKQSYSIVLQAVVDADKKFIDVYCGEPGSLHDSRVLRRSDLFQRAEENFDSMFPNSSFLLADSAYPCKKWLVPSYKDYGALTRQQKKFNTLHSSARIVVENAFGLLKGRFRRLLKFAEQKNLPFITNIVASACVIHNICISQDDMMDDELEIREPLQAQATEQLNAEVDAERRDLLFRHLVEQNVL